MIRRTRDGDWSVGKPNKADVHQHSRLHLGLEMQAMIGFHIMVDDVLARDLLPVVESFARMRIPRRKKLLHALPSSMSRTADPRQPSKSASGADLTCSLADTLLRGIAICAGQWTKCRVPNRRHYLGRARDDLFRP